MKKALLFLIPALVLFSLMFASAFAPTLVTPASSALVSGTVAWNVSNGTVTNMTSCNIWLYSPSTANSTYINISTFKNTSSEAWFINGTFNSLWVQDSNDYSILAQCTNGTVYNSSAKTGITINNGVPTAPSSPSPSDLSTNTSSGVYNFSQTVNDASTTTCTIFLSGANNNIYAPLTTTYSTTSCSASNTFSSPSYNGDYLWFTMAGDGSNTTNSSVHTLYIRIAPNSGGVANQQQAAQVQRQNTLAIAGESSSPADYSWAWWVVAAVVVIFILYLIFRKKKR